MLEKIKEVIVVEGKDDESAVKRAVECEIIITHGFGISEATFKLIEHAAEKKGVIIFTDPDHAGEQIRTRIMNRVKSSKHAFLDRKSATHKGNVGIENASPESIVEALKKVRTLSDEDAELFDQTDLVMADLIGSSSSAERREIMGKILGIGYCNGKQFLSRLNHYGISREAFALALDKIDKER